jgi:hypothetical protein
VQQPNKKSNRKSAAKEKREEESEPAAHLTTAVARFRFAAPKFCSILFRKTYGVPQNEGRKDFAQAFSSDLLPSIRMVD